MVGRCQKNEDQCDLRFDPEGVPSDATAGVVGREIGTEKIGVSKSKIPNHNRERGKELPPGF